MKYFLILFLGILTSCFRYENPDIPVNSQQEGDWTGTFSGDISGTIVFGVSSSGSIGGTIYYDNPIPISSEKIGGQVLMGGKFNLTTKSYFQFSGFMDYDTSNGKWIKGNLTGSYSFHKIK